MVRSRFASRPRTLLPAAALAALGALTIGRPASADQGFALGRFDPAFAGDRFFGVPSPGAVGHLVPHAMLLADYAHDPLVLRDLDTGKRYGSVVGGQVTLHLNATLALYRRVAVNLDLPLSFQSGDAPQAAGVTFPAPSAAGLGDIRVGARASFYGEAEDPFQLAVGATLWVPTGSRKAFAGDGAVHSLPHLIAGGVTRYVVWSVMLGADLRAARPYAGTAAGAGLRWGAALGFLPGDGRFQIGPEAHGAVSFADPGTRTTDFDVMAGAKLRFASVFVAGLGAGVGLAHAMGTPDFRALASFAYSPESPPPPPPVVDRDHDGVLDARDACPDEAGPTSADPAKNGCPVIVDRDGDGIPDTVDGCPDVKGVPDVIPRIHGCPPDKDNDEIPDAEDACPEVLGVHSVDPKENGCPPPADRDRDGIPDIKDACPDIPGLSSPDPKQNGCPGDRDGDGINDDKDACPAEKGPASPDPKKNGCPKDVRVTDGQIVILQQVEFDTNKATIKKISDPLLDTVASVLREHEDILRVEVGGHTDNRGSLDANTVLSEERANAVKAALVKRGIDAGRLTAVGYGPTRPIMSNITTAGRAKNRRVEFKILERRGKDGAIIKVGDKPPAPAP